MIFCLPPKVSRPQTGRAVYRSLGGGQHYPNKKGRTSGLKTTNFASKDQYALMYSSRFSAEQLRQEHRAKGMPESLVEVLHLAALADVRMLVFDADAPVLDGLPLYDDE